MTPQQVKASICALFKVEEDEGVLFVQTPLTNLGNDNIVVYVTPGEDGSWTVDDNGETAFALAMAGFNTATDRFDEVAADCCGSPGVSWDAEEEQFQMVVAAKDIGIACLMVATASARLITATSSRKERQKGDFKERLMSLIAELTEESGLAVTYDSYIDGQFLKADCRIETPTPTYVIAATSSERLTEAELIHSRLKVLEKEAYVIAVVEDIRDVGKKHYQRAGYFTDKAVEYDGSMFGAFLKERFSHPASGAIH